MPCLGIPEKMKVIYTYTHDCEGIPMLLLKYRKKATLGYHYILVSYFPFHFFYICSTKCYSCGKSWFMKQTRLCTYKMFHLHFPKKVDIYAKVCMDELTLAIDKILCLKIASTWISTFFTIHIVWVICLLSSTDNPSQIIFFWLKFHIRNIH